MEPLAVPEPAVRSALTSLPWWTSDALVVEPESVAGAVAPGVAAVVEPVAAAWAGAVPGAAVQAGLVAVPDPVPCWAACTLVTLRAWVLVAGEEFAGGELKLPRSACGANPLLSVDECATVVAKGCEAAWDFTAELTGVLVTGWLGTALPLVTFAAFARAIVALTCSPSVGAKDGGIPAGPLAARLEKSEKIAAGEYGPAAPGCTGTTWCSGDWPLTPGDST